MIYEVEWHEDALEDLKNINKSIAKDILDKVEDYLVQDPFKLGEQLKGHLKGFYKFKAGKYRIIYYIEGFKIIVVVVRKRADVYKIR